MADDPAPFPPFAPGDPAPWFRANSTSSPNYNFSLAAGRYILLGLFGSAGRADVQGALAVIEQHRARFDDETLCLFGVSMDLADREQGRLRASLPGIRHFWDDDGVISRAYGAATPQGYRPYWLLLDPQLRVLAFAGMGNTAKLLDMVARLPPLDAHAGTTLSAPILIVPRVLEPALCRRLIGLYESGQPADSGFMRQVDGRTIGMIDHSFKKRADVQIEDEGLRTLLRHRLERRLLPEVRKAFNYRATRIERYIVAGYDGGSDGQGGGFFRAHRDNTTSGTAHRKFAVTINLNAEAYQGGDLRFPEFGSRTYRAPTGGAVVFSCSLMHEALPVSGGTRHAFLPFLYDEEGAAVRQRNAHLLDGEGAIGAPRVAE